jgi:hypothetical protein
VTISFSNNILHYGVCSQVFELCPIFGGIGRTFEVSHFSFIFHWLGSSKDSVDVYVTLHNGLVFYGERLLAPCPVPIWRITPCWLSATTYSRMHEVSKPHRPVIWVFVYIRMVNH